MAENPSRQLNLDDYINTNRPGKSLNTPMTDKESQGDMFDQIINKHYQDSKVNARDSFNAAKLKTFGADMDHHQFERYYNHPKFKELGFNPYLDNEARYNNASSFGDDFRRTWGQWKAMTGIAFSDATNFGGGNFSTSDRDAARAMERAMAIGSSTRGGIGGFVNNTFLSSGYTVGIMEEIILEEAALWAGTALSGGALGETALARTGVNIGRLVKSVFTASEWTKKANRVVHALDKLSDVNTARQVYQSLASGAEGVGKFLVKNAAGETYHFLSNFKNLENLSGAAKAAHGFGAFYRDIRNVRLAWGESALEAGMVENEMTRDLYDEFVEKNGRTPNEAEAQKIQATAKQASLSTFGANLPAIYFTNNIALGNLTRAFSPLRRMLPMAEDKFFKTILTREGFEVIEKGFKSAVKGLVKPRTYGTFALNYFSANLAEGLQESAQEVISGTNKQYYTNLYNNNIRGGYYDAIADNIGAQFSGQGAETFASGFFMGGIVQVGTSVAQQGIKIGEKLINKNYADQKEASRQSITKKAAILNEYYKDPLKYNSPYLTNMSLQKEMADRMKQAEEAGDAKGFQDAKWRAGAEQLWTVFETGTEDTFLDRFNELQKLDDEELLKAVSASSAEEARQSLNDMASKMKEFKKTYDLVNSELKNPFEPGKYKQGTPEYNAEAQAYVAFRDAQKDLIFMRDNMHNTMKRMTSIMNEAVSDTGLKKVAATDVTTLFNLGSISQEIGTLKKELATLGEEDLVTKDAIELQKKKKEKLEALEGFANIITKVVADIAASKKDTTVPTGDKIVYTAENSISGKVYDEAFSKYKKYMTSVSEGPVQDDNLQRAFDKMIDFYMLDMDNGNLIEAVNTLINPKSFYEHVARKKEVIAVEQADRKQRITEALQKYEIIKNDNKILQELYKRNMFFDPADWKALNEKGIMPKRLYRVTGKDQVLATSSEYNEAIDLIRELKEGSLSEIPLQYNTALDAYDTDVRDKLPGDNRSYDDIAEQFGFDPKASKTVLPLKDVLQKIIESEFATEEEIALARRLLLMAKPNETVTFSKELGGPGVYTESEQTVIDARYSSKEYAENAQSYPIETSILREEVNRRVYDLLNNDTGFQNTIRELYKASWEYFQEAAGQGIYDKAFLGLRGLDDFVKEALTNEVFREFLNEVRYDPAKKSGWGEFVDSVISSLSSTEGDFSNTALNAAISAITTKIDSTYAKAQSEASGRPVVEEEGTNPRELSVEQIEALHPGLIDEMIKLYQNYNAIFAEIGDTSKMLDPDYASKTPEEIKNSPEFREYVRTNVSESLRAAFDRYFTKPTEVRTINRRPGIRQTITETTYEFLMNEHQQKLRELGYDEDEIADMSTLEGLNIIAQGETKAETEARLQRERDDLANDRETARQEVMDMINDIENFNDYEAVEAELIARLTGSSEFRSRTGFKAQDITELLNKKRQELAFKIEFDDINIGDSVVINNIEKGIQGVYQVYHKTKNKIYLRNAKGGEYTLTRGTFKKDNNKRYVFKYNLNITDEDMNTNPITNEEQEISNDDVRAIQSVSDEDIAAAINRGKKKDPNTAKDDFLDSLDDICG